MYPLILIVASLALGAPGMAETVVSSPSRNPDNLSAYVRTYYKDAPILADIAWCESRMRQFDKNGTVLRGTVDSDDVGVMQINTRFHEDKAVLMGMDLYTLNGNLAYAKYLYEKEGVKPWAHSAPCWGKLAEK